MGTKYFEENKSYPDGGNDNAYMLCIVNIRSRLKIMLTVESNNFTFLSDQNISCIYMFPIFKLPCALRINLGVTVEV